VRNEAAEAEELRAFRYTFRSVLAGPLLAARSVIKCAAAAAIVSPPIGCRQSPCLDVCHHEMCGSASECVRNFCTRLHACIKSGP
jgi:hypothetical protein